jgi:hypothetical protein
MNEEGEEVMKRYVPATNGTAFMGMRTLLPDKEWGPHDAVYYLASDLDSEAVRAACEKDRDDARASLARIREGAREKVIGAIDMAGGVGLHDCYTNRCVLADRILAVLIDKGGSNDHTR